MDLNAVEVFVKIVDVGSLSGAAQALNMPKTTVSARLAALEASVGVSLILRTTRKIRITAAGRRYFEKCKPALMELSVARAQLFSAGERPQGVLRITAPVDWSHTILPQIVHRFLREYPAVDLDLVITNRAVDLLADGVDLAIRANAVGPMRDSSLIARRFVKLLANVWGSPRYIAELGSPRHPDELANAQFVGFGWQTLRFRKDKAMVQVPVSARVKSDDLGTVRALIKQGDYIGWLPDFITHEDTRRGLLAPVVPNWRAGPSGQLHFVYPGQRFASPNVKAFIALALKVAAQGPT
jgi:DNA-binding transcriptional LysR family regulator